MPRAKFAAVEGDPAQIQQVLINLVRNAFDAMSGTPPSRRKVEIATDYNGDGTICVAVRDYGSGIAEPTQERLFEHFFTTKEEGLGMGLAIVRSIVNTWGRHCSRKRRWWRRAFSFSSADQGGDAAMMTLTAMVFVIDDDEAVRKKSGAIARRCPLQNRTL